MSLFIYFSICEIYSTLSKYPGRVQIIGDADKVNCIFDGIHAGYNAGCSLA